MIPSALVSNKSMKRSSPLLPTVVYEATIFWYMPHSSSVISSFLLSTTLIITYTLGSTKTTFTGGQSLLCVLHLVLHLCQGLHVFLISALRVFVVCHSGHRESGWVNLVIIAGRGIRQTRSDYITTTDNGLEFCNRFRIGCFHHSSQTIFRGGPTCDL